MLTIEGRTIFAAVEQGTSSLYFFLSSGVHGKKCIFFHCVLLLLIDKKLAEKEFVDAY